MASLPLLCLAASAASEFVPTEYAVWPPPHSIKGSGAPLRLHPDFDISSPDNNNGALTSARLSRAMKRYLARLRASLANKTILASTATLKNVRVFVESDDEHLGSSTDYSYSVNLSPGSDTAEVRSKSIYGAMYGLDSFWQLVDSETAMLRHSALLITDAPQNIWRGLMIDAGRRFFPMDTVKNLLDTMAGTKLNVLHLHASDHCRFGVESKLYPNLTAALTGIKGGFYTQEDIKDMIAYAGDRGIRVVPEFDLPGHSRGYIPIDGRIEFCTDSASKSQLFGDPNGKTLGVLKNLMKEMSTLFTDEVFNIGCDETSAKGPCTVKSTFSLEREVLNFIENELNKTAEGWEEVLFDAGAATNRTVVNAWARHRASEITATGRQAVESFSSHFYFTSAAPGGPSGWSKCWYDIATGVPASQRHLLLGGEMSMWSDTYCYINQCGAGGSGSPVGAALFPPERDAEFMDSIGGMIWPRGFVGAAAFWGYNSTADPASDSFVNAIWSLNDKLQIAGSKVCPSKCSCDQTSACGKKYIKPIPLPPPTAGMALDFSACVHPADSSTGYQSWDANGDGKIELNVASKATGLCITEKKGCSGNGCYPLLLSSCTDADKYQHIAGTSEIVNQQSKKCMDVSGQKVGGWECSADGSQANQHYAWDQATGNIVAISEIDAGSQYAGAYGMCLSVALHQS